MPVHLRYYVVSLCILMYLFLNTSHQYNHSMLNVYLSCYSDHLTIIFSLFTEHHIFTLKCVLSYYLLRSTIINTFTFHYNFLLKLTACYKNVSTIYLNLYIYYKALLSYLLINNNRYHLRDNTYHLYNELFQPI